MTGGRPQTVLDDETDLNGPRVDVDRRVGWILRMARTTTPGPDGAPLRLEAMAEAVGVSTTRLHRVETGVTRSGRVADAYERVLGMPEGSLRAPVDIICRTFPYAQADREPGEPVTSTKEMSALTEALLGPDPTGGQWLRGARALAQPGAIGLPEGLARDLVRRLADEMSRSVGHAYPSRYEAMALLRCSAYGHLVLEVAQEIVGDPHVQVMYDLMSAVGERPSPDALAWCLELLDHGRDRVVIGGALAIEAMAEVAEEGFWAPVVAPLVDRLDAGQEGTVRHDWLSHLLRLVPRPVVAGSGRRPAHPLAPVPVIPDWSRTRVNPHWSECQERAWAITEELRLGPQPMLARLLFDIAIGPFESRAATSYFLLRGVPTIAAAVGAQLGELVDAHADPLVRERAGRRLVGTMDHHYHPLATRWIAAGTVEERDRGLRLAGSAGHLVPEEELRAGLTEAALYAAGMAGHPCLPALAADPTLSERVRGAAAWWLRAGSRLQH
ncbi:helix-turn-helix domain-containing protein [Nocardioides sp. AX2bis]|uniref:helix-turn-helix domain-containing protein n=1 Tax=Nocardioides sp. AX2bis TaxID=2653157 RepID=UPI0012F0DE50|nr:helix-turn-helix transcriptional regulator [Nocardioides sp. AX2bis]VXC58379.1 conserved hypothetical protein [Nocardioides sp. AX2bis]